MAPLGREMNPFSSLLSCFLLAVAYVGSLYVWRSSKLRDHPDTIKRRFKSVALICCVSPLFVWYCTAQSMTFVNQSVLSILGIRLHGLIPSLILPLLLTMILFLGPLALHFMDGIFSLYLEKQYWKQNAQNLMWLRSHVVAPFSEEFVFRACMLPLLVPSFGASASVFICPLFFGVAHFHHMLEKIRTQQATFKAAFLESLFQFSYTTVFGAYSAFLFLRTGHVMAPALAHAFCNHMGFPDFQEVLAYKGTTRLTLAGCFVAGLLLWMYLLYPLTNPYLYGNNVYRLM